MSRLHVESRLKVIIIMFIEYIENSFEPILF